MTLHEQLKKLPVYTNAADVPMGSKQEGLDHYKRACDLGLTFWQYMEIIQPSKAGETLTAFERQLQLNNIVLRSDVERGLYSSTGEYFFQSDRPGSAILFPTLLQKIALWAKMSKTPDINKLVATTRTIAGTSSYQSLFIDDSAITGKTPDAKGRRFRVDQRGNFPEVKIGWAETANAVTKHGVKLAWTYEFVRRASIELMSTVVARIMIQDQVELFNEAISIAINGDGTAGNPAAVVKRFRNSGVPGVNDISLATPIVGAGAISYEGWLKWIGGFDPYTPKIVVGNLNTLIKLVLMAKPNIDPLQLITTLLEPKNQGIAKLDSTMNELFPNTVLYKADNVPNDVFVGLDNDFALERVIELGSDLQETEKVIGNQTENMVLSIADGVSKIFPSAIQVLDFSAAPLT